MNKVLYFTNMYGDLEKLKSIYEHAKENKVDTVISGGDFSGFLDKMDKWSITYSKLIKNLFMKNKITFIQASGDNDPQLLSSINPNSNRSPIDATIAAITPPYAMPA